MEHIAHVALPMQEVIPPPDKQCRICLDGPDDALGRLIRPCLCRGSISYVHVRCLNQWRKTSISRTAFFKCPQCNYRYHFARTRAVGLATNPVVIASVSTIMFTVLVFLSSFITTAFLSLFQRGASDGFFLSYGVYLNPFDAFQDLVASTLSIFNEEFGIIDDSPPTLITPRAPSINKIVSRPSGPVGRFLKRFLLGLPLVGMGSLVQMLLSMPLLGPVQWIAQYRRRRRGGRSSNRDTTTIIVIILLLVGAARALIKVYDLTQKLTKRVLLRAEDIILEVN